MKKQVSYLRRLFYDIWNDFGSVFLLVKHSDRTRIGRRGFTEEEKKQGLLLIFNNKTNTRMDWDEEGNLACVLAFGSSKEEVFIHHDDLLGVFSREAGVQFLRSDSSESPETSPPEKDAEKTEHQQVVSLNDFRKRKP